MTVLPRPRSIALLVALCLTLAGPASAQERSGSIDLASVSGIVSTVSGNIVTVMNGRLAIDTTGARFEGRSGSTSIADVRP
ncbi:MAG TPA: hypothetical protein VFL80_07195, partial [Thermoanaerobaculia bacterium]|nr:hypothetical protein [Thermoanaerobaculia bacterium]